MSAPAIAESPAALLIPDRFRRTVETLRLANGRNIGDVLPIAGDYFYALSQEVAMNSIHNGNFKMYSETPGTTEADNMRAMDAILIPVLRSVDARRRDGWPTLEQMDAKNVHDIIEAVYIGSNVFAGLYETIANSAAIKSERDALKKRVEILSVKLSAPEGMIPDAQVKALRAELERVTLELNRITPLAARAEDAERRVSEANTAVLDMSRRTNEMSAKLTEQLDENKRLIEKHAKESAQIKKDISDAQRKSKVAVDANEEAQRLVEPLKKRRLELEAQVASQDAKLKEYVAEYVPRKELVGYMENAANMQSKVDDLTKKFEAASAALRAQGDSGKLKQDLELCAAQLADAKKTLGTLAAEKDAAVVAAKKALGTLAAEKDAAVVAAKKELERLAAENEAANKALEKLIAEKNAIITTAKRDSDDLKKREKDVADLSDAVKKLEAAHQKKDTESKALATDLAAALEQIKKGGASEGVLEKEKIAIQAKLADMTAQLERVKSDAATTLKTASDNHEATLQTLRAQSDDLRNKFNAEKQRADGLQTLNATQKTSLSTADAQIKNLTAELAAEADKVSKNAASIVQLKEQLKVADEKIKKLTTDIAEGTNCKECATCVCPRCAKTHLDEWTKCQSDLRMLQQQYKMLKEAADASAAQAATAKAAATESANKAEKLEKDLEAARKVSGDRASKAELDKVQLLLEESRKKAKECKDTLEKTKGERDMYKTSDDKAQRDIITLATQLEENNITPKVKIPIARKSRVGSAYSDGDVSSSGTADQKSTSTIGFLASLLGGGSSNSVSPAAAPTVIPAQPASGRRQQAPSAYTMNSATPNNIYGDGAAR